MVNKNQNQIDVGGNNNSTAGGDINYNASVYNYHSFLDPLRFFDDDIKEIIIKFSKVAKREVGFNESFNRVKAEKKNEINCLSENYFNVILEGSMCYFQQIEDFLLSPINDEYLKMYENTVDELNQKIVIHREKYEKFDLIFDALYNLILENNQSELRSDRRLIWVMLHYMYWKCDLGEGGEIGDVKSS